MLVKMRVMILEKNSGFMMGKYVSFFVLSFLFLTSGKAVDHKKNESAVYVKYANEIINSFVREMKEEFNLHCSGSGGGMPYDVEEISVGLVSYKKASIEDARELEVMATERLLKLINEHEKIRPFLREYPFKANRAKVAIYFSPIKNAKLEEDVVARVTQIKNKIYYLTEEKVTKQYISLAEEPYEEALKIVQKKAVKL